MDLHGPGLRSQTLLNQNVVYGSLFVAKATSYVDLDDDANPTLKSLVSGQYAMDGIIAHLRKDMSKKVGEDSETCPDLLLSRVLLLGDGSARLRRDLHRS